LLPIVTHFSHEKQTVRAGGQVAANAGLFAGASDLPCNGYEIHMGRTVLLDGALPLLHITRRGEQPASDTDGAASADGRVAGTYMHGLFENNALRHALLANLAAGRGIARAPAPTHFDRAAQYDRLAAAARAHLDMARLSQIIERGITQ
jgi:adenosylcobyric acid synthase